MAGQIAEARPDPTIVTPTSEVDQSTLLTAHGDVENPQQSDGTILLNSDESLAPLEMMLPGDGTPATVADDGTVVYDKKGGLTLAVQGDDGEARVQSIVDEKCAEGGVSYEFPGLEPETNKDGSVLLTHSSTVIGVSVTMGLITARWVMDSAGRSFKTHCATEGNTAKQSTHIDDKAGRFLRQRQLLRH